MSLAPEVFYGAGALLLVLFIAFGVWRYGRRNRANDPIRELATHELYERPQEYERTTRKRLAKDLDPED